MIFFVQSVVLYGWSIKGKLNFEKTTTWREDHCFGAKMRQSSHQSTQNEQQREKLSVCVPENLFKLTSVPTLNIFISKFDMNC